MTAIALSLAVAFLASVGAVCFRWWLAFRVTEAKAEREARLAEAAAAPQAIEMLRKRVVELESRQSAKAFQ